MKRRIAPLLLLLALCALLVLPCAAAETDEAHPLRFQDEVGLLTENEIYTLTRKLDEISERLDFDVTILVIDSLQGTDPELAAEYIYNNSDYGMGDGGILFLFAPNDGANGMYGFFAAKKGEDIFDDAAYDELENVTLNLLREENYVQAFNNYAETCDEMVSSYGKNDAYGKTDDEQGNSEGTITVGTVLIALAAGIVLALLIPMNIYRGQLKSVRSQPAAANYVRSGSMQLTLNRDMFLYRNVTRTARPKETSSGGSAGKASSGSSRGGSL